MCVTLWERNGEKEGNFQITPPLMDAPMQIGKPTKLPRQIQDAAAAGDKHTKQPRLKRQEKKGAFSLLMG